MFSFSIPAGEFQHQVVRDSNTKLQVSENGGKQSKV